MLAWLHGLAVCHGGNLYAPVSVASIYEGNDILEFLALHG